jgi:hypothetical protein
MMPESVLFSIIAMFEDLQSIQVKVSDASTGVDTRTGKFESNLLTLQRHSIAISHAISVHVIPYRSFFLPCRVAITCIEYRQDCRALVR